MFSNSLSLNLKGTITKSLSLHFILYTKVTKNGSLAKVRKEKPNSVNETEKGKQKGLCTMKRGGTG